MKINNYSKEQIILFFSRGAEKLRYCAHMLKIIKVRPEAFIRAGFLRKPAGLVFALKAAKPAHKNGKAAAMHFQTNRKK